MTSTETHTINGEAIKITLSEKRVLLALYNHPLAGKGVALSAFQSFKGRQKMHSIASSLVTNDLCLLVSETPHITLSTKLCIREKGIALVKHLHTLKAPTMREKQPPQEPASLTFSEYEAKAGDTAFYPNRGTNPSYPALGLCGESGEVAEKIKKLYRDKGGELDQDTVGTIAKELGDVLWYVAAMAHEIGIPLSTVAEMNLAKLQSRQNRDKLQGDGDDR